MHRALAILAVVCATHVASARADGGARALGSPSSSDRAGDAGQSERATESDTESERAPTRDVYCELTAFTHMPLFVGGAMALELARVFVLRVGAGVVPGFYLDAVNDVGTGWQLWGASDAATLRGMLGDAIFLEAGGALRPTGASGIELAASYALLWAHTVLSDGVMSAMGAPDDGSTARSDVGLDLYVHAVHVELAGVFTIADVITGRLALGWMHALGRGATFAYDRDDPLLAGALPQAAAAMEARVDAMGFGPTLSASLGVRL